MKVRNVEQNLNPLLSKLYKFIFLGFLITMTVSCSIKTGINMFEDDSFDRHKSGTPFELEVHLAKITHKKGHSDISTSFFHQSFDLEPNFVLMDIDATWRYFPREFKYFQPYIGGGVGYYKYRSREWIDTCPAGYSCYPSSRKSNDTTLSSGFNPNVLIGAYVPIGIKDYELIFEANHEFLKEDNPFNMNSTRFLIGIKWGPPMFK